MTTWIICLFTRVKLCCCSKGTLHLFRIHSRSFKTLVNIIKNVKTAVDTMYDCWNGDVPYKYFKEMSTYVIAFADGLILDQNVRALCTTLEFNAYGIIIVHLFYFLAAVVRGRTFAAKRITRVFRVWKCSILTEKL